MGCIGFRRLDDDTCELKRLYVKPEVRGKSIGRRLVVRALEDAASIGYCRVLLDTLPTLQSAIALYKRLGFYETEKYNDNPILDTVFMRRDLQAGRVRAAADGCYSV